jgi:hypothetical protein
MPPWPPSPPPLVVVVVVVVVFELVLEPSSPPHPMSTRPAVSAVNVNQELRIMLASDAVPDNPYPGRRTECLTSRL